jgi:hypothetical protein
VKQGLIIRGTKRALEVNKYALYVSVICIPHIFNVVSDVSYKRKQFQSVPLHSSQPTEMNTNAHYSTLYITQACEVF